VRGNGVTGAARGGAILRAAVLLLAMLVAGCAGADSEPRQVSRVPGTRGELEPLRVVAAVDLPGEPRKLAVAGGKLWVSFTDTGSVAPVDPRTNRIGRQIRLANGLATGLENPMAGDRRQLWAIDNATERAYRINPRTQKLEAALDVDGPIEATLAFGSLWIAEFYPYKVVRVDPLTSQIRARISASGPTDVEAGGGSIWVLAHHADEVLRVDPQTNRVSATIPLISKSSTPERLAFGEGALWVTDTPGQSVTRVDPETNTATKEIVMPGLEETWPQPVSTGGGYVWVGGEWHVFRVDPRTNTVTGAGRLARVIKGNEGGGLTDVKYAFGSVWAVDAVDRKLYRVAPRGANAQ
jgi:streptogramin lyase